MDFVDPGDAPGVGTPVRGGVTYREAHLAMEMIADSEAMVSLEVVEINPVIDLHNKTALLGVEMVLSGLGKRFVASRSCISHRWSCIAGIWCNHCCFSRRGFWARSVPRRNICTSRTL